MDAYWLDWANLLLRWAHVVVAIAWIGASFYFVFLDSNLTPPLNPADGDRGVTGELWAVHGGGFYHPQKYLVAPKALPEKLHWFYWESYATWLTGFGLFAAMYLFQPSIYLIDKAVFEWSAMAASLAAVVFLGVFWLLYDVVCRLFGAKARGDLVVGMLVVCLVAAASWLVFQLFAGRAAFLLIGAMMATAMTANVFFWIIPGQRAVIRQMQAGQAVNPVHGQRAKQRSLHNTYFTLPVLVAMLSNHYSFLYSAQHAWLVLLVLMSAGALIRHSFVARHAAQRRGTRTPWQWAGLGLLMVAVLAFWLRPDAQRDELAAPMRPSVPQLAEVRAVIEQRCVACHNAQLASKGVRLDTPEAIQTKALQIHQQAVVLKAMPINNATGMTPQERDLIKRWVESSGTSAP